MSLAEARAELNEFKQQLDEIKQSLKVTPDNTELQTLKTEIEDIISESQISIAQLEAAQAPKDKSSVEKDPAPAQEKPKQHHYDNLTYHVNEVVQARFEDDRCFHPARIVSVMGPPTNRMYMVVFTNFSGSQQVSSKDIAKNDNHAVKKRKADSGSGAVVSAAPVPSQTQKVPAVEDHHVKKRKIKNNAQLEAGKAKWQDFNAKSKGKGKPKKDSMFRTGDGINARVGFTGSGQQMRKDQVRTRHVYKEDHHDSD